VVQPLHSGCILQCMAAMQARSCSLLNQALLLTSNSTSIMKTTDGQSYRECIYQVLNHASIILHSYLKRMLHEFFATLVWDVCLDALMQLCNMLTWLHKMHECTKLAMVYLQCDREDIHYNRGLNVSQGILPCRIQVYKWLQFATYKLFV